MSDNKTSKSALSLHLETTSVLLFRDKINETLMSIDNEALQWATVTDTTASIVMKDHRFLDTHSF